MARELGLSLNKTVIRLLEQELMPRPHPLRPRRHRELEDIAGTCTAEEADEFDRNLEEQRRIDPELWR